MDRHLGWRPGGRLYYFGNPGDKPFVGDFDGDGVDTVGLHRESTGFVYLRNSHTQGFADLAFYYGDPGDRLVAGDWIAQEIDTVGVFRPAESRFYLRYSNSQGFADESFLYGQGSWLPVAGTFGEIRAIPDLTLQTVATGLSAPVFLTSPPGDPRLFVVEQPGRIKVLQGGLVSTFLDITGRVGFGGERGLLGLAFHPGYSSNGRFFVHYTRQSDGDVVVEEYRVSGDPSAAEGSPVKAWLVAEHSQFSNHNGGMLEFGPDGWLYAAVGGRGRRWGPTRERKEPQHPARDDHPRRRRRGGWLPDVGLWVAQPVAFLLRRARWPHLHRRCRPERLGRDRRRPDLRAGDQLRVGRDGGQALLRALVGMRPEWPHPARSRIPQPGPGRRGDRRLRLPGERYHGPAGRLSIWRPARLGAQPPLRERRRHRRAGVVPGRGLALLVRQGLMGELYLLTADGQVRKVVPVGS